MHFGAGAQAAEGIQEGHDIGINRSIVTQGVNQDDDNPASEGCPHRRSGCGRGEP